MSAVGKYGPPVDHQLRFNEEMLWWERVGKDAPDFGIGYVRKMRLYELLAQAGRDGLCIALIPDLMCCPEQEASRALNSMRMAGDVKTTGGQAWLGEYFPHRSAQRG